MHIFMNRRIFGLFLALLLVSAFSAPWAHAAPTYISGAITPDTVWKEINSPYVVSGVSIAMGATLTIEPGVVVKMSNATVRFEVSGTLIANGTPDKKIYFTSISDDEAGGDTNGDGSNTSPQAGNWVHIVFNEGSTGQFASTVVRYAGSYFTWQVSSAGIYNLGGDISITGSEIYKNAFYGVRQALGTTTINFSNLHDETNALISAGGFVEITNSNLYNNTSDALEASNGSLTLINNNFQNNSQSAGFIYGAVNFNHSQNGASGNRFNAFTMFNVMTHDQTWNEDLVYMAEGFSVASGTKLTILPGVVVKARSVNDQINVRGGLDALGTPDKKIYFTTILDDEAVGDTNGDGSASSPQAGNWAEIYFRPGAIGNFSNTIVRYAGSPYGINRTGAGIANESGTVSISDSQLAKNGRFGFFQYSGSANIIHSEIADNGQEGIRNYGGNITVSQSSIHDNPNYGINNLGSGIVMAENNWWGAASGPHHSTLNPSGLGNPVSNNVDFDPWLGYDPVNAPPPPPLPTCCSSVLFLPGLEASRLYLNGGRLWEPTLIHANNTEKLFLNFDGTPQTPGIYTNDVIDESYGSNIYKSFIAEMDQMVADGKINAWKSYPYDWRRDINDIVEHPTLFNDTAVLLIEELEKLKATSQTGQVTIITHSNGGLVAKMLINKLVAESKTALVDKLIMVASPQLGTPKAVAGLLHGEGMPIEALPFMMSAVTSRALAENMPSAYTLLPSSEYLVRVLDPVVEFDPLSTLTQPFINNYGLAITNSTELRGFLLGAEGREKPATSDTMTPNILNTALLAQGATYHVALDSWQSPPGVETIQIVGWGIPTLRGIKYFDKTKFNCIFDCKFLDHEPIMTVDGDNTVVVPSAMATNVQTYYLNLKRLNIDESLLGINLFSKKHVSILEALPLLSFIKEIIQENPTSLAYITTTKPLSTPGDKPTLRLKVHSPASLDIYDVFGRHTGISTTTSFFPDNLVDEQIPNSYYMEMGEGKYAGVDMFGTTTISLVGQDFGVFTLDIEKMNGDALVATSTFKDIPVALGSLASLDIADNTNVPKLNLDINGDGIVDSSILPGEGLTTEELIGILIGFIKTLHLPEDRETQLIRKVDKLAKTLNADYYKKQRTDAAFANLIRAIDGYVKKGLLTSTEAAELKSLIGKIQGVVVE
ncbi:hypothetical protein A3C73_04375 [Candidatus Giovannonibacteria bacterium RIFCSPHIGHO2_02_FULL_44_11]|nr:MAG: hypothetical protein A3C73_04375 [Candidatus Giovannonibacteria bacterium RIFCSPHIGHO2_02_FULL_44_11]